MVGAELQDTELLFSLKAAKSSIDPGVQTESLTNDNL